MNDLDQPRTSGAGRWAEIAKAAAQQRTQPNDQVTDHQEADPDVESPAAAEVADDLVPGLEQVDEAPGAPAEKRRFFSAPAQVLEPAPVNPLLPGAPVPVDDEHEGAGIRSTGLGYVSGPAEPPLAPAPASPAVVVPSSWPARRAVIDGCVVQLVGLHGGAGTSTLAALIGPEAADCGHGLDALRSVDVPVLFVTRSHARGLDLALRIGQQYASRTLDPLMVLGLVVVDDAPTLSKGLARTLRSVEKTLPNCWRVGWDEDLRHDPGLPPAATRGRLSRDIRRIVKRAEQLVARRAAELNADSQST